MSKNEQELINKYHFWSKLVLGALFILFLAGGVVRSTGSGLGCPDWPKCFGSYIPPTSIEQLPHNYKEVYQIAGRSIADFDVFKTWTEYINRLWGAVTGLIILSLFICGLRVRKFAPKLFAASLANLILVGIQGVLGKMVVSSLLAPYIVTLHMFLALVIVFVALLSLRWSTPIQKRKTETIETHIKIFALSLISLILIQILLGTQVREAIDHLAINELHPRETWMHQLPMVYSIHRAMAFVVLFLGAALYKSIRKSNNFDTLKNHLALLVLCLFSEIAVGAFLAHYALPRFLQPIHLLLSTLIFTILADAMILYRNTEKS